MTGGSPTAVRRSRRFLASSLCGLAAVLVSYLLRSLAGGVFIPELGSQTLFSYIPTSIESSATEQLGELAKYTTYGVAILVTVVIYGALGTYLFPKLSRFGKDAYLAKTAVSLLASFAVFSVIGLVLLSLTRVSTQHLTIASILVWSVPPQVTFGALLAYVQTFGAQEMSERPIVPDTPRDARRRFYIKAGVGAAVALGILLSGADLLLPKTSARTSAQLNSEVQSFFMNEVTENSNFYRVDININAPEVDVTTWQLQVSGDVSNPLTLTYSQLTSMQSVEQYNTLECISNLVGGDLMSTAKWTGVKLEDILSMAGASSDAVYVVFKCYDGYDVGIPIQKALEAGTLLAFQMNGMQLPPEHGYPLRAIVPGLYGQHNAKWITSIEVVDAVYQGFWQRRGWANDAQYNTTSIITIPGDSPLRSRFLLPASDDQVQEGEVPIAGIAFAGDRGIKSVEVSTDGGATWRQASLQDPLSGYTWVLWSIDWNPSAKGSYQLTVRATDGQGNVQTSTVQSPFPDGATGYFVVDVSVVA